MKQFLHAILLVTAISYSTSSFAQDFSTASSYMAYIGQQQENISKKYLSYSSASGRGKKARKVENLRQKLLNEVQEARMNISGMPSFNGDKSYRDTAVNFMKLYFNILNEDYNKIINMEDIAEQSYDEMEAFLLLKEMIDVKLEEGNKRMSGSQAKFAAANNINLIEGKSELTEMLKQVHGLNEYYNDVYLIFFKPFKQEDYLMEAMAKSNFTGIEQTKGALLKYAQEGMEKLKTMKGFQGDRSIEAACKNLLNFYVREAEAMKTVTEFFLIKEKFDKLDKDFKKKSSPSEKDIENFNKSVNEINAASSKYNSTNNSLNAERKEVLREWNNTVEDFFRQHTPKYK